MITASGKPASGERYFTYAQKLEAAAALYWGARALKEAYFRLQYPTWRPEEVRKAVRAWMLYARS